MRNYIAIISLIIIILSPCYSLPNPESPFGIVCPWDGLKDAGIKWVRCGGSTDLGDWVRTESEPGKMDWLASDNEIASDWSQDLLALPILSYTPKWASSDPQGSKNAPPKDMLTYANFARAFGDHYKGKIDQVEIWNEPNIPDYFTGSVCQYAELLQAGYAGTKLANPNCKVVFGGTAGVDLGFIGGVYDFVGSNFFDVLAVHPYQHGDEFDDTEFSSQLRDLRKLMNSRGDISKPIWLTEFGWSSGDKGITEDIQARLLVQSMVTALTLKPIGVEKMFWFTAKDSDKSGYGIFRANGARKPSRDAYSTLTKTMRDVDYVGAVDVGKDARCYIFRRISGAMITVIWAAHKDDVQVTIPCQSGTVKGVSMFGQSLNFTTEDGKLNLIAKPEPIYLYDAGITVTQPADSMGYIKSVGEPYNPGGVWVSALLPDVTARPVITPGESAAIPLKIYNINNQPVSGFIDLVVQGGSVQRTNFQVDANSSKEMVADVSLRPDAQTGVCLVSGAGQCNGKLIQFSFPIRVSVANTTEFLANSTTEKQYLYHNENSSCAQSVRSNGTWVYKFDISKAKEARIALNIGADEAKGWKVSASRDDKEYKEILSGTSMRTWKGCNISEFAGGLLFLKFEGEGQQLEELMLTWR